MTAIKRSAQASLLFIHSGALPPAGISQSWTATSCPAFLRLQAIQCALARSAELKLMKNFCPMDAHYRAEFPEFNHQKRLQASTEAAPLSASARQRYATKAGRF